MALTVVRKFHINVLEDVYINTYHASDWQVICAFGTHVKKGPTLLDVL